MPARATLVPALLLVLLASFVSQPVLANDQNAALHTALRDLTETELRARYDTANGTQQGALALWLAIGSVTMPELSKAWTERARAHLPSTGAEITILELLDCVAAVQTGSLPTATACEKHREQVAALRDPSLRIVGWSLLTNFHWNAGQLSDAISVAQLALSEAESESFAVAKHHNNIAILYQQRGWPIRAIDHLTAAQESLKSAPDPELSRTLAFNLGVSQLNAGRFGLARDTFTATLQWSGTHSANRHAINLIYLAKANLGLNEPQTAIEMLTNLLQNHAVDIELNSVLHARQVLAEAKVRANQQAAGLSELQAVLNAAQAAGNEARIDEVTLRLAEFERPERALALLNPLIALLEKQSPSLNLRDALEIRASQYAAINDPGAALRDEKRSLAVQRKIDSDQFAAELELIQARLELEQQSQQLALAEQREKEFKLQNQLNRTRETGLLVLGLLLLLVAYLGTSKRLQMRAVDKQRETNERLEARVIERTQELEQSMAERLNIEEDRRQLQQRLMEGEKLRALGQLTGGVAHDFNNLMTIVRMSTELLQANPSVAKSQALQYVRDIERAAKSAADITSDLLAYARQQPLKPEIVDLADIVRSNEALFRRTLGAGIELNLNLQSCAVRVDPSQLTTCLLNLLLNAGEAMQGSGSIDIEIRRNAAQHDERAEVRIIDRGRGMNAATVSRATEPFFTTKPIGEGSGLGLSMVYGFASQSGGELHIDSEPDAGTTVTLSLPLTAAHVQSAAVTVTMPDEPQETGARLLIVEDQPQVRAVMQRLLTSQGFNVDVVADAAAAWDRLQQADNYDLLVTDVVMPGPFNGYELSRRARARQPQLAILVISGYATDHDDDFHFLAKPFSLEQLLSSVQQALRNQAAPTAPHTPARLRAVSR